MVERYSSVMSGSCAADFISVSQMACRFGILFMALRLLSFVKVVHDALVFLAIAHHDINAVTFAAAFACKRIPTHSVLLSVLVYRTEWEIENTCGASNCSYKRNVNRCIPMLRKEKVISKV